MPWHFDVTLTILGCTLGFLIRNSCCSMMVVVSDKFLVIAVLLVFFLIILFLPHLRAQYILLQQLWLSSAIYIISLEERRVLLPKDHVMGQINVSFLYIFFLPFKQLTLLQYVTFYIRGHE